MNWVIAFVVGSVAGVLAALCGVGGGIVMVPAFGAFFGLTQKQAVATSLAVIIPVAIAGTVKNWQSGFVDWKIALATAAGAVLTALLFQEKLKTLSDAWLTRFFGIVVIIMGIHMLITAGNKEKSAPPPEVGQNKTHDS